MYEKFMPLPDRAGLEKLLDNDVKVCMANVENEVASYERINQNYVKFLAEQQKSLQAFVKQQEKVMYGGQGAMREVTLDDFKEVRFTQETVKIDAQYHDYHHNGAHHNWVISTEQGRSWHVFYCNHNEAWIEIDFKGKE